MSQREVLVLAHTGREAAVASAAAACRQLRAAGIGVRILQSELGCVDVPGVEVVDPHVAMHEECELVLVLGGDGTLLRAAELARPVGIPLLGINLGHIGFLAEAERDALETAVDRVINRAYEVEERMTVEVEALIPLAGTVDCRRVEGWALNEASVEKGPRVRMIELVVEVDARPVSRWGGDGVVMATPTGSTAYAFSAGGPVVWPEVEALLLVPVSAHALFARPLVASPHSTLAVEVLGESAAVLWCDGRRTVDLPPGSRVEVKRGRIPVRLARLRRQPFADRLSEKFDLPVTGWRGHP